MFTLRNKIRYSECDARGRLSVPALIDCFQDCSTFHTQSIDAGFEHCSRLGFAWFIAAWQIRIVRMPLFEEDVRIDTWVRSSRQLFANRSYAMSGEGGEELVRADSLWFPFDLEKGRPMRIPESEKFYLDDEPPFELPPTQRRISLGGEGLPCPAVPVVAHHLDSNRHVNNGKYVEVACDIVSMRDEGFSPREVLVAYKTAAKLGDVFFPTLFVERDGYGVSLADAAGNDYAAVRMRAS